MTIFTVVGRRYFQMQKNIIIRIAVTTYWKMVDSAFGRKSGIFLKTELLLV